MEIRVAAGEVLDDLVAWTVEEGWSGLEALSGIPGLVGAAPVQNVGAYGAEFGDVVHDIIVWDRAARFGRLFSKDDCEFGYRDSVMKRARKPGRPTGRYIVEKMTLRLREQPLSAPIRYAELAQTLGVELGDRAPLADVRAAVLQLRRGKGMVVDAADPDTHSAGSFFTNPLLTTENAARLPEDAPRYPQPDGSVKTSAAWLIEHAGFPKGYGDGPARLSSKHTLALTNQGGATASDIVALARTIREGVQNRFGVTLDPEPVLIGVAL